MIFFPKVIYENLPYLYFMISGGLLFKASSFSMYFSAGLFYTAACIVLVNRSSYRRKDKKQKIKLFKRQLPLVLYEYLPYFCCATAIIILKKLEEPLILLIAFALLVFALRNLMCRWSNRTRAPSLF